MWVFDATPLIYLAKAGYIDVVQALPGDHVIPDPVYEEVVETGIQQDYPDARRIERCIADGMFDAVSVENNALVTRLRENQHLSDADAAVLSHAGEHDGIAVMDETYGRDVASSEGISTRGTAYILLSLAKRETISVEEARTGIDAMIEEGWYCAPDMYAKILQNIESLNS